MITLVLRLFISKGFIDQTCTHLLQQLIMNSSQDCKFRSSELQGMTLKDSSLNYECCMLLVWLVLRDASCVLAKSVLEVYRVSVAAQSKFTEMNIRL